MILMGDCLLSLNRPSLFRVSKADKAEEQFHASFMHDVGKSFQRFFVELDIYVKLTAIRTGLIYTYIYTRRNLNKKMTDLELHGMMHQIYDNFWTYDL